MGRSDRRTIRLLTLGLIVATLAAFEGVRHNGFVFDDSLYITYNPHVQDGLTAEAVGWAISTPRSGSWHPLTWLSHLSDVSLFGLDPLGHHLVSLLLHVVTVVLLCHVFLRMTGRPWLSVIVAALFAVHPLRVESVAWVAERKDVLSGLFWMLTMLAYVRWVERPSAGRYALMFVCFAAGLLAKPMLVTLPLVLLLLDYWPLRRFDQVSDRRGLFVEKLPLFLLVVVFSVVTILVQRGEGAMVWARGEAPPLWARALNASISYMVYIFKTVAPVRLASFYPHPGVNVSVAQGLSATLAIACVTAATVAIWRRQRFLVTGWLWYLVTLVPVIGLVQVGGQALADRYTYLPSIGLYVAVVWAGAGLIERYRLNHRAVVVACAALVIALIAMTRAQVRTWRDDVTLHAHARAVTSDNWMATYNLGRAELDAGRGDDAVRHFREALTLLPDYADVYKYLGIALAVTGQMEEAITHLREAVRLAPADARAVNALGKALSVSGDRDGATPYFEEAIRIDPRFALAHYNLAAALAQRGDERRAREHVDRALRLDPGHAEARRLRAMLEGVRPRR